MKISPFDAAATDEGGNVTADGGGGGGGGGGGLLANRFRYILLALTTLCLTLAMCNATALHFTVICMKCEKAAPEMAAGNATTMNGTTNIMVSTGMFTFKEETWLFSALYLGTLLSSLAVDTLCNLFGFRLVATIFGLASGFATLGTPFAALWLPQPMNFYAILLARLLEGFALALSFLLADKFKEWSSIKESTLFIGIISTHFTLGRTIIMGLAGIICESPFGWPLVYYVFGAFTVLAFLLFYWLFRDSPQKHWRISAVELDKIQFGKERRDGLKRTNDKGKYIELFTNPYVWAIFLSSIGLNLGNQLLGQFGPTYLKKAVGLSIQRSGFIAALPYLLSAIVATLVGRTCDKVPCLQRNRKMVLILTTACTQYAMAICYLVLSVLPASSPILIQCFYVLTIIFVGIWVVGIIKHVQFLAQSRSQTLMAINTALWYFEITFVPTFVNLRIPENEVANIEQWQRLFLITAGLLAICGFIAQISIHFMRARK